LYAMCNRSGQVYNDIRGTMNRSEQAARKFGSNAMSGLRSSQKNLGSWYDTTKQRMEQSALSAKQKMNQATISTRKDLNDAATAARLTANIAKNAATEAVRIIVPPLFEAAADNKAFKGNFKGNGGKLNKKSRKRKTRKSRNTRKKNFRKKRNSIKRSQSRKR